jgi:hypothetical protein
MLSGRFGIEPGNGCKHRCLPDVLFTITSITTCVLRSAHRDIPPDACVRRTKVDPSGTGIGARGEEWKTLVGPWSAFLYSSQGVGATFVPASFLNR